MLITFIFSYLKNIFAVFYLSFYFYPATGRSARDQARSLPFLFGLFGCVCSCWHSACTRPVLAVVGGVCVSVRVLAFTPRVPAGVLRYVCLCACPARTPPFLDGVCGVWVGCPMATVPLPWFVACCARCPGLRHPVPVVAWHLSVCLGGGRQCASLACPVTLRGTPRLFRSGRSCCSRRHSRCPACVLCPLELFCGACGLSLLLGAVVGLPCCTGFCCAVSPCVGVCCVCLFGGASCAMLCWRACVVASVRCSLAPLALAGAACCCLLFLGVCCWAWLSPVVSWWLLVAPGVVSPRCCPWLAAWLAALWFGVVCLGALLPCVVSSGAVLSCGGVLLCSAIGLHCRVCLLFLFCFKSHCQIRKNVFPCLFSFENQKYTQPTHPPAARPCSLFATHVLPAGGHILQLLLATVMVAMLFVSLLVVVLLKFARG